MERRMSGNAHVRCEVGENPEIISKDYLSLLPKIAYPDGDCTSYEYDLNDRLVKVTGRDNKYHRRSHKSR